MNDIKSINVPLSVRDHTRTTHVTTTGDHNDVPSIEFNEVGDFALLNVKFNGVVYFDLRVRVSDGTPIVCHNVRHTLVSYGHLLDFAKLVGRFFRCDTVNSESALDVVEDAEVFTRFFNRDNVLCLINN